MQTKTSFAADKALPTLFKRRLGTVVPYFSVAVYAAFLLAVGVFTDFGQETLGLLLAGNIALTVGLIDDFGVLTPLQKLLGQTLATLVPIKSGIYIAERVQAPIGSRC